MIAPWPLTGRTAQLEELGRHYRDPARAGVVLHGPAGVGKTRLAEEALRLAERGGRRVERAVGHPATREIPLGALAHLLPADLTADLGVGDDERTGLFHAARAELRRLAGDDRLVLLVDDLDLLDDTSVAVLVPLVVSRTVFLVGTVRTGRTPSAQFAVLHRDGHLVRMEIGPARPRRARRRCSTGPSTGPVSGTARAELARLSGGNLQVLTELVRGARERGVLVDGGGAWDLVGPLSPTTARSTSWSPSTSPASTPAGLAVLELLAVCERFGLADLEQAHGRGHARGPRGERPHRRRHVGAADGGAPRPPALRRGPAGRAAAAAAAAHPAPSWPTWWRPTAPAAARTSCRSPSGGSRRAARSPCERLLGAARLALAARDPALAIRLVNAGRRRRPPAPRPRRGAGRGVLDAGPSVAEIERVVAAVWDEDLSDGRRAHLAKRLADTRFFRDRDLDGAARRPRDGPRSG